MEEKKKYLDYDVLRAFLVILVLLGHCTYYSLMTPYGGIDYSPILTGGGETHSSLILELLETMKNVIYTFHMPLFFMLSGALFANSNLKENHCNLWELTKKKFKKLIIPFIVVTLLFSSPLKYLSHYFDSSENVFFDIIVGQLLLLGNSHLWFLPTLFCVFIVVYLLEHFKLNRTATMIVLLVLNYICSFLYSSFFVGIINYSSYFYMGYLFHIHRDKIVNFMTSHKMHIFAVIFGFGGLYLLNSLLSRKSNLFITLFLKLNAIALAVVGSLLLYYIVALLVNKNWGNNFAIKKLNEYSFGIYLYADTFNYLILYLFFKGFGVDYFYTNIGAIVIFMTRVVATLAISMLITFVLKKCKAKYIC